MQDMAHSICLIKLYQIMTRKKFDFLFLTTLMKLKIMKFLPEVANESDNTKQNSYGKNTSLIPEIFCMLSFYTLREISYWLL